MTNETILKLRSAAETFVNALNDAALAMESKDDMPPVPPIPEQYAGEFAHEEPPRYATPKCGERFLWQSFDGELLPIVGKSFHNWTEDGNSKRWILRKLPTRPPMPAPANECWWCDSQRRWITVEEVYGGRMAVLRAPEGKEFTGEFGSVRFEDSWMDPFGNAIGPLRANDNSGTHPRLILRPAPKPRELRFEETSGGDALCDPTKILWKCKDGVVRPFRIVEES